MPLSIEDYNRVKLNTEPVSKVRMRHDSKFKRITHMRKKQLSKASQLTKVVTGFTTETTHKPISR